MGKTMRRTVGALGAVATLLAVSVAATAQPPDHPTVCHRTGSTSHPFVTIHPSSNGAYNGHLHHDGDVIPPFEYQGQTYSLNWPTAEVDIVAGECVLAPNEEPPAEEPPEVEPGGPIVNTPPFTG
jgi:hypothetical protein